MRVKLLSVFIICALFWGCNEPAGEAATAQSGNLNNAQRVVTAPPSPAGSGELVLSVPPGDFLNEITVFAFYDRKPSGIDGISIHYEAAKPRDPVPEVTLASPVFTEIGITIQDSQTIHVTAFLNGKTCGTEEATYEKKTEPRAPLDPGSKVMLQGFNWESAKDTRGWYRHIMSMSDKIKSKFDIVWFPPPSKSQGEAVQGYGPTELNDLNSCYGSAAELTDAVQSLKPAEVLADVVINHRNGTTDWADFSNPQWTADYKSICVEDSFFKKKAPEAIGLSGGKSSGEIYEPFRNIDHTNLAVQKGIISWMNSVLYRAGFTGWRYDFSRGYAADYAGYYSAASQAVFSVGEYWPSSSSDPGDIGERISTWRYLAGMSCGDNMYAFDFVLKGALNAFSESGTCAVFGKRPFAYRSCGGKAVTFVENHDTGSTQKHWEFKENKYLPAAYAFILMSPGVPCVFWDHYFQNPESDPYLKTCIDTLIDLRKNIGIKYNSSESIAYCDEETYIAKISGDHANVVLRIGESFTTERSDLAITGIMNNKLPVYVGPYFCIWVEDTRNVVRPPTKRMRMVEREKIGDWKQCFIHCWDSKTEYSYTAWPGLKMQLDDTRKVFFAEIPEECDLAVFNNGAGEEIAKEPIRWKP